MIKNIKWFSFAELIVSVIIVATLSSIWIVSYNSYIWDSRDSQRKSDIAKISSALKIYKQKRGYFPRPGNAFEITYNSNPVAIQWEFNQEVRLSTLDKLLIDPKTKKPYFYSVTNNSQEYELWLTLENENMPKAITWWNYKTVSINILPSIILAVKRDVWQTAEIMSWVLDTQWIDWSENNKKFILNNQTYNLPYDFEQPFEPKSDLEWKTLEQIINELKNKNEYWQNSDFRNCFEIEEANKNLQSDWTSLEYQIVTETWAIIDTNCTFSQ